MSKEKYQKVKLNKSFDSYDLYIFDLDGTLYFQKPFRIRMAVYLATYVLSHPMSVKDIFIIKKYREVREKWDEILNSNAIKNIDSTMTMDEQQYEYVALSKNTTGDKVKAAVDFFMMKAPLKLLPDFADTVLRDEIEKLKKMGRKVVIYSDYPVADKLNALNISADEYYTSGDEKIGVMKPDKKGIEVILSDFNISNKNAVMIGDRYEKDGLAAIANDVDYVILSGKMRNRKQLL